MAPSLDEAGGWKVGPFADFFGGRGLPGGQGQAPLPRSVRLQAAGGVVDDDGPRLGVVAVDEQV